MVRRSPQEKKALSYAKDRRNDYGENDKSSRKNIRRSKRIPNRADRRRGHQILSAVHGPVEPKTAECAETDLRGTKSMWVKRGWRKRPDIPLREMVAYTLRRRAEKQH